MKKKQSSVFRFLSVLLTLLYPFVVFFALQRGVSLRFVALLIAVMVVANFLRSGAQIFTFLVLGLVFSGFLYFFDSVLFFKFYPVFMNFLFAFSFTISLFGNREPVVVKFASGLGYDMSDDKAVYYARNATIAWCVFLCMNTLISFITVFMGDVVWMVYNGFVSYVLIGIMMLAEYVVRRRVLKNV